MRVQVFGADTGPEEIAALEPSVTGGWMGMGPRVAEFERAFSQRIAAELVMVNSGTSALHLAIELLDLPAGSDVVLPSFTWVGCAHAVALAGHRPVFADVALETQNMGPDHVEAAITDRTAAIMAVHYAGKPAPIDELAGFGVPIVEDAAHAVDSRVGERWCGTLGELGVFSFDSVKNLATPDGGAVICPDPATASRARQLRYCGIGASGFERRDGDGRWWEPTVERVFPRMLPNDVSASIGLAQLQRLAIGQQRRRDIWDHYDSRLAHLPWLETPVGPAAGERHSYFTYLVRVTDGRRDALARELLANGVYTTLRYAPLHRERIFDSGSVLPNTERLAEEALNLPLHPGLSDADVEHVAGLIAGF
ncbi:MAG TPA: DegT/DnrJ/EryC1/StrS family aminotransferase [Thermoleophilaceae bacterium]|nr:DegT/DnrJ/EryC1/StrS family aminotransferase [Thermoleophilaceae bacterium]